MAKALPQPQKTPATQTTSGLGSKKATQPIDLNAVVLSNSIAHISTSQTGSQAQLQTAAPYHAVLQQVTPGQEGRQTDQTVSISPKMPKSGKDGAAGVTFANQNPTYGQSKFHNICL